ncbi:MAG: DUF1501 domain-containing protein [Planctomycetota bacterium]|nr:MAG: DUF1501 domain-containing protein [Planctomycetota bacterium]
MNHQFSRRQLLQNCGAGFGGIALNDLLARTASAGQNSSAASNPLLSRPGHFPARAKRVIFLFMHGGPSHVDTFDYKPLLAKHDGQPLPFEKPRIQFAQTGNLLKSPWKFRQYGQSGAWVSDLFPNVGRCADDITFIKSIHGSNEAHGGALLKINTGSDTFVRPSMGAWISYGLGTENDSLPSFVTINPTLGHGGVRNFGSAFLPPIHQATRIATSRDNGQTRAKIANLTNEQSSRDVQLLQLGLLRDLNRLRADSSLTSRNAGPDSELNARIDSFELAFCMQTEAPEIFDLSKETESTRQLYGIDQEPTSNFGTQCLLARRLSESGVRFVQVSHAYWDQHSELKEEHTRLSAEVDKPIAGLLQDLKQRGLLEDTILMWGAEFGRTPTAQGNNGRDHNPHAFTYWMAGGGVKAGFSYGESDDFGFYAAENKVHVHDLHATILHLLGLDHEQLTFRYGGRDFRLTDVEGKLVSDIIA